MLNRRMMLGMAVAAAGLMMFGAVEAAPKSDVAALCPVSGKPISKDHSVDYKGGKLYFCCPNCPKAFQESPEKFAEKANHQLVATGQATQTACPFTGKPINKDKSVTVKGVEVYFCCGNCEAKAEAAGPMQQVGMIFTDKAFDKAYEVKTKM